MRGRLHKGRVEAEFRPVEEGGEFGKSKRKEFRSSGAKGHVAEFPARPGGFSVKVQVRVGDGQDFRRFREASNQVEHSAVAGHASRAERQAENSAKMVFKLTGDGSFDGPVAGIVDARRHLVGQQAAFVFEKLDSQDANVFQ